MAPPSSLLRRQDTPRFVLAEPCQSCCNTAIMTTGFSDKDQAAKWMQHLTLALPEAADHECIWVHACSVGEINSIAPLVRKLLDRGESLHLTVVTATGMQQAIRLFGDTLGLSYLPWDLPGTMNRLINRIRPRLLLLTETEFWPGMLSGCARKDIPVIGINTRISDRSFPRYMASRQFWRRWLRPVRIFLAQSAQDAERLEQLGIEADRIRLAGNLKYAVSPPEVDAGALRWRIDPSGRKPIIVIGSSHEDEERRLLRMWPEWRDLRADLILMIVPRHPERFDRVAGTIEAGGHPFSRWSSLPEQPEPIVLVDGMGVLQQLYTIADLAIIGGSLVPVGGHNPLEAAVCGRGVITGPHTQNFREIMDEMVRSKAAIVAADDDDLNQTVIRLLQHPDELRELNAQAARFIRERQGTLELVWQAIEPYLDSTAK